MFRWVPYAMVRIAAFFIAGILLAIYHPALVAANDAIAIFGLLVLTYFVVFFLVPKNSRNPWIGICGLVAILAGGYIHLTLYTDWGDQNHLSTVETRKIVLYVAEVTKPGEDKEKSWKYNLRVLETFDGQRWSAITGRSMLYIRKEEGQDVYAYGDKVLIQGHPQLLEPPQNPHEFNFRRFLGFNNTFHQQFARNDQVKLISNIRQKDFKFYSYKVREWAATQLKKHLPNAQEQSIALALTLGVTDGIDNELQSAYAASGAMHVLAVSGLHVGILYGIVLLLLRPFQNLSWSRWLVAAVSLFVLWSFAFITGLSPSVLRAVTMFSFIAVARPFGRSTSIYNTLASSAFLLLLYDPYLVMSVGFQLSYLAVIGIVSIHGPLYRLWEPKSRILDWVWNISCVSIAAQLATFSLGVLYFHQFPVYFLFSNLFVIPGAILILILSIVLIAVSFLSPLSSLLGFILQWSIKLLNEIVFTIEKIPFSLISDIRISTLQCWLLIMALFFTLLSFSLRKLGYFKVAFLLVVVFSTLQWSHFYTEVLKDRLIVYKVPGHLAVEFISNGQSVFFADSSLLNDEERLRFHIKPNRLFCGVKETSTIVVGESEPGICLLTRNNKVIGLINDAVRSWPAGLKLDYLILGNNSIRSLAEIRNTVNFDNLILAANNSGYTAAKISNEDQTVHSVLHQGAFEVNF